MTDTADEPEALLLECDSDETKFFVTQYLRSRRVRRDIPFGKALADFGWGDLPPKLPITLFFYKQMFDDFHAEISNEINALAIHTHKLKAWGVVLQDHDDRHKLDLIFEFVQPTAIVALNLPSVIRERIVYAAANLSYEATKASTLGKITEPFPAETTVHFNVADKFCSEWKAYKKLKLKLERLSASDYKEATEDFRNAYNHRFAPRVALGMSNMIKRRINTETNTTSYAYGGTPPLALSKVVDQLDIQHQRAFDALAHFKKLVAEHEALLKKAYLLNDANQQDS